MIDRGESFIVAWADDPDDWVVAFEKSAAFPARDWAERMAALYNASPHEAGKRTSSGGVRQNRDEILRKVTAQ